MYKYLEETMQFFMYVAYHILAMTINEARADDVGIFFLKSFPNVGWPQDVSQSSCFTSTEVSRLSCFRYCASTVGCVSVYTILDSTNLGPRQWTCYRCTALDTSGTYPPGQGFYAFMQGIDLGYSPPVVPYANFQKIDYIKGVQAAFYDCPDDNIKIRLGMDQQFRMWPRLGQLCTANLCYRASLTTSLMQVSFNAKGFRFEPSCLSGETTDGFSRCFYNGTWEMTSQSGVHCISPSCYRRNGRSFYKGNKRTTYHGIECQRWDVTYPHNHGLGQNYLFVEDGFSYVGASNYCRDPDGEGAPWCYTTDVSLRWTFCDIPRCD